MKQFKSGDAVRVVINKGNLCYGRLNGLVGKYGGHLLFGHSVFIPELGYMIIADDVEPIGKTLLEILVDELPKRGGWRYGASVCVQDGGKEIKFNSDLRNISFGTNELKPTRWTSHATDLASWGWIEEPIRIVSDLAIDYATKIVTREEYERAVAIKASEDLVKATVKRLADACAQHDEADDFVITAPSDVRYINSTVEIKYPAGYHIPERPMPWLSNGKKSAESKFERIERLHNAFKSAKSALDAEFKPIIEIMDDLELGDCFTVKHNKDGLVNFRVIKVISELDGQGQAKDRKLFVKKLSTGDEYALTKEDKSYAVKVS